MEVSDMAANNSDPVDDSSTTETDVGDFRNSSRREIVQYLRDNGGEASLSELAFRVRTDGQPLHEVITTFHDVHIPELERRGVVEFEPDEDRVNLLTIDPSATRGDRDGSRR